MIVNKFGDIALMLSICVAFYFFKTVEFTTLFKMAPFFINESINLLGANLFVLDLFSLLLFIAAIGKSAQLGLHM
jgi:NADH-quinone oxidoreductase subunit L